jgi:hypothetical protein
MRREDEKAITVLFMALVSLMISMAIAVSIY